MNIPMPLDATPITGRQVPRRRWPAYQKTRACSSRAMGEPFVTFAFSYVHTIFCCFSVFVPFDASLTVSRWLHNLQTKRRPEAGIYPGRVKESAGRQAGTSSRRAKRKSDRKSVV